MGGKKKNWPVNFIKAPAIGKCGKKLVLGPVYSIYYITSNADKIYTAIITIPLCTYPVQPVCTFLLHIPVYINIY